MDNTYKLASLNNKENILEQITKYENELAGLIGQEVVLIAYTGQKESR